MEETKYVTDKNENMLESMENLKKYFTDIKVNENISSKNEEADKVINVLSKIIEENSNIEEHKKIGTKINKFNYEKYVSCKKGIEEIKELVKGIEVVGVGKIIFKSRMDKIQKLEKEVTHKINIYEKGKK